MKTETCYGGSEHDAARAAFNRVPESAGVQIPMRGKALEQFEATAARYDKQRAALAAADKFIGEVSNV